MKTGLSAIQHVKQVLLRSVAFREIADTRIYSVAARMGATMPYVAATRTAIVGEYTKDGWVKDSVVVAIDVVANDYDTAVKLAEVIRSALEGVSARYPDFDVRDCVLNRATDGYNMEMDAFVCALEFTLEIY